MWRINSFANTTLIALCMVLNTQPAQSSLDKQAVANTQQTLASDLDAELPRLPFGDWFERVVGLGTGVIWQLSECGERAEASPTPNEPGDMRACVEANTILRDGRKVIVLIVVGTFKKGVTGAPTFNFGVIEQNGELRTIRRLRDLPKLLSAPGSFPIRPVVRLPEMNALKARLATNNVYIPAPLAWNGEESVQQMLIEEPPPPVPPLRAGPTAPNPTPTAENRPESEGSGSTASGGGVKLPGDISFGDVITKVQPRYPTQAKRVKASGPVNVQITISETGRVVEAKATSGHPLLREAAVEAARQWIFKPAILNGSPVKTETTLVFVFTVPQ